MRYFLGWSRKKIASGLLVTSVLFVGACSSGEVGSNGGSSGSGSNSGQVIRIAIGTQDQVINTAVGGATVRELELLEKHLPTDGKYEGVRYEIEWSSYTSGPPITNKMLANQLDIGLMGDFPAVINLIKFQQEAKDANSVFVGTLAYSPTGAGNAVVVPKDSTATSLADLKGGTVSVPFGSAAHGMLLNALADAGLDPETDVELISQAPEVGGASLRTGQIDAHADFVPFGELFPFRGFARKIFDGAQTGVPTLHGIVVRTDFAEEHPEIVVAYLKAILEANQMFREDPEGISAQIQEWSGVDKEVVYMFLGPSGLQPLNPTIGEVQVNSLKNSIATLTKLGRLDNPVDPAEVTNWIDESYLLQAMEEMGLDYDEVVATAEGYQISGEDALTGEAITDPKQAAQFWVQGEETVRSFASIGNMVKALVELQAEGQAANVMFVHDHNNGWKLFAENSYFVSNGDQVAAFLIEADAQTYAASNGGQITAFRGLQDLYAARLPLLAGAQR
ncbi:ABC transporter substrate-binding protein [Leptolyngbya sp. KIOST-1]|uniref:ABC transporter substrate-binding protein n=1 Tax=Leptolyngbya sp. KIOST-1 TaxID=1229172 RepID=UPI000564CDDA|nr:ABC transporter substrate-binding protein [Leptolyngbya sp. KIOST-1]